MEKTVGLKIDVDTYQGMKKGVPRLLSILDEAGIKGTFYLSIGPDASGRALLQLIKNPRFLKKMIRTNAPGLYGFRTVFYGTLLPSPMIALSFPELVRRIIDLGHEVQFHAWDHRRWQDELGSRSSEWIKDWFGRGVEAFKGLTGVIPASFGAPAWLIDDRVLEIVRTYGFSYLSCTRARMPFIHAGLGVPEIPSDLPCFEETGVEQGKTMIASIVDKGGVHVLPVHAEAEGGIWDGHFIELIGRLKSSGCSFKTLSMILETLSVNELETRKYRMELLPGRSVPCAV